MQPPCLNIGATILGDSFVWICMIGIVQKKHDYYKRNIFCPWKQPSLG